MWPRVNQISRTLLFHTHFSQIRYQIKAKTQTHKAKQTEWFLCLLFLKESNFVKVRRNIFGQVYSHITLIIERNSNVWGNNMTRNNFWFFNALTQLVDHPLAPSKQMVLQSWTKIVGTLVLNYAPVQLLIFPSSLAFHCWECDKQIVPHCCIITTLIYGRGECQKCDT